MNKPQTTIKQREAALKKELATRVLARRSLLQYTKRFHPSYEAGWVHEDMCRRLEQFSRDVADKKSPRLMLLMPPRSGKQLAHDTPVLTTAGWATHGQLRPGDGVFHPSGKPVNVIAVSDDTPSDVRVELTDGSVFYTHENHEWLVYERSRHVWRVVDTKYLMGRTLWSSGRAVFQLPVTGALQYPEAVLPMDPYAFGAWLGDGSSTKPCITHAKSDMAVVDAIEALGYPRTTVCVHQTTGVLTTYFSGPRPNVRGRMTTELQSMGLMTRGTKHIPEVFLRSSVQQRLQLLAGLIDTDGHIDKCSRVIISSVLPELVKGIFDLARGLGFRPYTSEVQPITSTSGIVGRQVVYTVGFQPTMAIPCRLPRKQVKRFATQRRVGVRSVSLDPCGKTGRCIQVDSPDGLYVVGETLVPTHNSELASIRFPAWHLGHHPEHEIINCGYNLDLPMKFSRKVREQLRDKAYLAMFPESQLDAESQSVEAWNTTAGGGFTAAGVGGGITGKGAHCVPAETLIHTEHGLMTADTLYRYNGQIQVWSFDHESQKFVLRPVVAMQRKLGSAIVALSTESGRTLRCTEDHRVFTEQRGYIAAREVRAGEQLVAAGLRVLRSELSAPAVSGQEGGQAWLCGDVLQPQLLAEAPCCQEREALCDVLTPGFVQWSKEPGCEVLFRSLSAEGCAQQGLPAVLDDVFSENTETGVLHQDLRGQSALGSDARSLELSLLARDELQPVVRLDEAADSKAGQMPVRGVFVDSEAAHSSHRRGHVEQPAWQPGDVVSRVSHEAPQVEGDTVSMVVDLRPGGEWVYDFQVAGTHNFIADEVLVHNCLLIDDPVKNMEEADSAVVRDGLWDWYWSTAYTRLAPGGGVLLVQTLWHDDDLAGRLHKQMLNMPDADQFVIIKYPALAEADEYLTPDGDLLRVDPELLSQEPPPEGSRLLRPKGESLHPERYPTKMMENYRANMHPRIWSALYQQNPVPDEGMYFKAEWFRTEPTAPMIRKRRIYQAWDFAIGEKQQNDFTVGATLLHDENNFLHVLDIVRFKGDTFVIIEEILNMLEKWSLYPDTPVTLGFEDGQIWRAIKPVLEMRMQERNLFPPYEVLKPLTDKLVRARALQGRMQQGRVLFLEADWLHGLKQEMMRFPAGAHDDQCFKFNTKITMADGRKVDIINVQVGDQVMTPTGPQRVSASFCSSPAADVVEVSFSDGSVLCGTAGHPVYVPELHEFVPLGLLTVGSSVCQSKESFTAESPIAATPKAQTRPFEGISTAGAMERTRLFIAEFGRTLTARFHLVMSYITKTATLATTRWTTSSVCPLPTTGLLTGFLTPQPEFAADGMQRPSERPARLSANSRLGTLASRAAEHLSRFRLTEPSSAARSVTTDTTAEDRQLLSAECVVRSSRRLVEPSPAQTPVESSTSAAESLSATRPGTSQRPGSRKTETVLCAGVSSRQPHLAPAFVPKNVPTSGPCSVSVRSVRWLSKREAVYNLTVEGNPVYYANGVLVHNCDALAWACNLVVNKAPPTPDDRAPVTKSWKDKLSGLGKEKASHMAA